MRLEYCYRHLFNFEHRNEMQELAILDLQAQVRSVQEAGG